MPSVAGRTRCGAQVRGILPAESLDPRISELSGRTTGFRPLASDLAGETLDGSGRLMSLDKALNRLPRDRTTENTVRAVLESMVCHESEWLRVSEVSRSVGRPEATVAMILSCLAVGHILRADGDRYSYERDPVVELDVRRFLRTSGAHSQLVQENLARFRNRYGRR